MKSLIVYYSLSGNNELLAKKIYEQWKGECELFRITETHKRTAWRILLERVFNKTPKLRKLPEQTYDHYVLIGPVWMGKLASPLKSFIINQKKNIKKYSFITLCGGIDGQKKKLTTELIEILSIMPEVVTELRIDEHYRDWKKERKLIDNFVLSSKELSCYESEIEDFVKTSEGSVIEV